MLSSPGNAGFETANHIVGNAAYIHMAARCVYAALYVLCGSLLDM